MAHQRYMGFLLSSDWLASRTFTTGPLANQPNSCGLHRAVGVKSNANIEIVVREFYFNIYRYRIKKIQLILLYNVHIGDHYYY